MQFLRSLTSGAAAWDREALAASHLPYLAQIDDHTIMLRDGRLMQVLQVPGLLFETAETADLNYRKALRDTMLQAIGSSRFALYHHIIRRRVDSTLDGVFPDSFSTRIDDAWRRRLATKQLFVNDLYVTVIRRQRPGRAGLLERLFDVVRRGETANRRAALADELRALSAARDAVLAALGQYGARLLGSYDGPHVPCSELLEFLSSVIDGEVRPVQLPEGDLGNVLVGRRISFGAQTVEFAPYAGVGRRFGGIVSIKDYPGRTTPGMLDDLLRLPFELLVSQSFAFVDRSPALNQVNLALRRMRAGDDEAVSLREELVHARDDVSAGRSSFGEHHLTVMVRADDPAGVDEGVAEVQAALIELGLLAVREDMALEPAFWAQLPGNFNYIPRRGLIASRNFASFASLHNFPVGARADNHWGEAVTVLETTAAGPYHFNFHHGDLGNFTVIGPSGSGKTVILNFLLAQALRFDPRIIFFDKDRGAELFLRAIGGSYHVLRVNEPMGLNPLLLPDTPDNRHFLVGWLTQLVESEGRPIDPEDLACLKDAVDANMSAPRVYRRLGHFTQLLRGGNRPRTGDLASRLMPWCGSGERAWLFDNAEDRTDVDHRIVGFDMTRLLDDPVLRTPVMMYLFHRAEERLDGTPSIIVIDEGWKALDDQVFTARIRDWEKTIRKRNGIVGFATQSAEDALNSRIASAIVEQAATQIFMANPKAQERDYVGGFGLTQHEYDLVRSMPDTARAFLIKHGQESVVARLDLGGERDLLTILSGREATVRMLDAIRVETGDDPAVWMPQLLSKAA